MKLQAGSQWVQIWMPGVVDVCSKICCTLHVEFPALSSQPF